MILKGSQRGGAMALGTHLLKAENEHVEVHEFRGFASETVLGAMKEAQAVARGTRCKQFLFSLSLSPPERESVSVEVLDRAVGQVEEKLGLSGQPRMIVFHEKDGRRHAHAVWSRIDAETMTARPLPFFKMKLREVSKALYLEHGWEMARGLIDSKERDPRNFDLAEWQQAKRTARDPKALKATIQECWSSSKEQASFAASLERRGLYLAKGDRRGFVAVTYEGEALSIARQVGAKTKDVAAKLGSPDALRDVAATKAHIAGVIAPKLKELIAVADRMRAKELQPLVERRHAMKLAHRAERHHLDEGQRQRATLEARERAGRLRTGVMGLWDRFTGTYGQTVSRNMAEAYEGLKRDRSQRQNLVADQLKERQVTCSPETLPV